MEADIYKLRYKGNFIMGFIKNLPAIISLLSALIVCFIGVLQQNSFRTLCLNVSITIIIFYIIGLIIQKIMIDIIADVLVNKKRKERQKKIEKEKQKQEQARKHNQEQYNSQPLDSDDRQEEDEEEFSPLTVRKVENKASKVIANPSNN